MAQALQPAFWAELQEQLMASHNVQPPASCFCSGLSPFPFGSGPVEANELQTA